MNSHAWALLCCPFKWCKRTSLPGVLQSQKSMSWKLFQQSDKNINPSSKCLNCFCVLPFPCSCRSYICPVCLQRGTCQSKLVCVQLPEHESRLLHYWCLLIYYLLVNLVGQTGDITIWQQLHHLTEYHTFGRDKPCLLVQIILLTTSIKTQSIPGNTNELSYSLLGNQKGKKN